MMTSKNAPRKFYRRKNRRVSKYYMAAQRSCKMD